MISGDIPVWGAYLTGLTVALQETGTKFNLIFPDDYGIHFYAGSVYATDDFLATHPDLVTRFLRATLKGWTLAVADPSEAALLVRKYNPNADIARELLRLRASQPIVNTGEDKIGWMRREVWAGMYEFLTAQHLITANLNVDDLFTDRFVTEAYKAQP